MSSYCKQDLGSGFLVQITFDSLVVSKLVLPKTNKLFFCLCYINNSAS